MTLEISYRNKLKGLLMAAHTLRYTSPAKVYHLTPPFSSYTGKVNDWTVSESIQEHPQDDLRKEGVYEYRVVMEKEVSTEQDLSRGSSEARIIASELELTLTYAAARPFHFMRLNVQIIEGPSGWSSNFKEAKQAIRKESQAKLFWKSSTTSETGRLLHSYLLKPP
jgi:hypothetical protein